MIESTNFKIIRGDTFIKKINMYVMDENGNYTYDETGNYVTYQPSANDVVRFALKENYNDDEPLIYKVIPSDTMILRLESEDTKVLEQPGKYVYDIQITLDTSPTPTVITFIRGKMIVVEEVE